MMSGPVGEPPDITIGEIWRYLVGMETRTGAQFKALDDRLSSVSQSFERSDMAQLVHSDLSRRIGSLEGGQARQAEHGWSTRSAVLVAVVSAAASGLFTSVVTLLLTR